MRISDWSSDVCSSDLQRVGCCLDGKPWPVMESIGIAYGQTITVRRGVGDRTGDKALTDHHTIDDAVFWPESIAGDDYRRDTSTVYGYVAVPRGEDLPATDRLRLADHTAWAPVAAPPRPAKRRVRKACVK